MDLLVEIDAAKAIGRQLAQFDVTSSSAWGDLDVLASRVVVDGVELDEDSVVVTPDGKFEAIAYIYLVLQYGKGEDGFSTSESFRADIAGTIEQGDVSIESLNVDTGPFYE